MTDVRRATHDPALEARVTTRTPLHYADGESVALDRPAHVRAGSSLARVPMARVPNGLALVQDDAHFVALVDPATAAVRSITLPAGPGGRRQFDDGRGNKAHKLDLEACFSFGSGAEALFVALGSGSTPRRETAALVRRWDAEVPEVRLVALPRLYAALREARAFAGSELNVEGATVMGDRLRLFGRGNGAPMVTADAGTTLLPVNATCDLALPLLLAHLDDPTRVAPMPTDVVQYELGAIEDVPLSFTDGAAWRGGVLFSATAEASPDATRDGRVTGSAIGVIDGAGRTRWAGLTDAAGRPFTGKVEGLLPANETDARLWVVIDADDPAAASELCTVELSGSWLG